MQFEQIRSATSIVTFGGVRFLIDPWLAPKDSFPPIPGSPNPDLHCPIHDLPQPVDELLQVDAVIATHLHFDHFDEAAMQQIPHDITLFAQDIYDADTLRRRGFRNVTVLTYAGIEWNGVTLHKTPCQHGQASNMWAIYERVQMRGEACGVIMQSPKEAKVLYLVGDSIWYPGVQATIDTYQPGVIVINAAGACVEGSGLIIMGLEDVQTVMNYAPKATVIASHMDNVGHATVWRRDLRKLRDEKGYGDRLLIPEDGEVCRL